MTHGFDERKPEAGEPRIPKRIEAGLEGIIPTAYGAASYRALYTKIPYSKDVFAAFLRIFPEYQKINVGPKATVEARFLMTDSILDDRHADQILDLGSGLSPRGMTRAQNPSVTYVELDLPKLIEVKQKILHDLTSRSIVPAVPHLHLEAGSAIEMADVERAARHFQPGKPLVVICEGLLKYFDKAQMAQTAKAVHALLEKFGGVWLTSDIDIGEYDPNALHFSGINKTKGSFASMEQAAKFFIDLGFDVDARPFDEALKHKLVAPATMGLSKAEVDDNFDPRRRGYFIMRLKA